MDPSDYVPVLRELQTKGAKVIVLMTHYFHAQNIFRAMSDASNGVALYGDDYMWIGVDGWMTSTTLLNETGSPIPSVVAAAQGALGLAPYTYLGAEVRVRAARSPHARARVRLNARE